jgi:hypothetical protein
MRLSLSLSLICVGLLAWEASALAAPTELAAEADLKDALTEYEGRGARPLTLTVSPFTAIVAEGVSGSVEYLPVRHLGIVAAPRTSAVMNAWVGEAGMRYWSGKKREASGFFIGPSAVYGRTRGAPLYGLALDCGVQTIFDNGITLGAGFGVQYLQGSIGASALEVGPLQSNDSQVSHAILPRLLFNVGYSL